jgi:lipid-A-disaccharide synthase
MGFVEVLFNLKVILSNIKVCKRHFKFKPDVIFIDYPGFMHHKWAKELGIRTHYYISPQIWAWKKIGLSTSNDIDKMYVILPFEKIL